MSYDSDTAWTRMLPALLWIIQSSTCIHESRPCQCACHAACARSYLNRNPRLQRAVNTLHRVLQGGEVLRLEPNQMHPNGKPEVVVSCPRALARPEGLALYHNWMYVASSTHGSIVQVSSDMSLISPCPLPCTTLHTNAQVAAHGVACAVVLKMGSKGPECPSDYDRSPQSAQPAPQAQCMQPRLPGYCEPAASQNDTWIIASCQHATLPTPHHTTLPDAAKCSKHPSPALHHIPPHTCPPPHPTPPPHHCLQLEKLHNGSLALVRSNSRGHRFSLHRFMKAAELRAAPWGLATGPDDALYVTMDQPYDGDYSCPPLPATGCIVRVQLNPATGHMTGGSRFGPAPLHRPSGLHFTPAGDLLVTTLERKVLLLAGPQRIQPGACLRSFGSEMWGCGDMVPFDGISADGRTIVVSLHKGGLDEGAPGCLVLVCMDSGRLLRGPVYSAMLQEGSAMCVYHQG